MTQTIIKTQEQIDAEIAALKAIEPNVRPLSTFGDSNTSAIRAQIRVLCERLSDGEIDDIWSDNDYLYIAARDAVDWMNGTQDEPEGLAESWKSLVV